MLAPLSNSALSPLRLRVDDWIGNGARSPKCEALIGPLVFWFGNFLLRAILNRCGDVALSDHELLVELMQTIQHLTGQCEAIFR